MNTDKFKKNFNQLITSVITIGFITLAILLMVLFIVDFSFKKGSIIEGLLIHITGSLGIGLFVVLIWDKVIKLQESGDDEFVVKEIHRALKGLRKASIEDAFAKAADYVVNCEEIRVIGTAKQDHRNGIIRQSVDKYLNALTTRITKSSPLKYRRLTTLNLSESFQNHLLSCFQNNRHRHKHDIKLMLLEDFVPAYTYLIIDSEFLMLSLNYPEQSSVINTQFCFYTEDKSIINEFIEHFKAVWTEERKSNKEITNGTDFRYLFEYQSRAAESIRVIKTAINEFPNSPTYSQEHALNELAQTANRFKGISVQELEINHTITNGNLVSLFCIYISLLEKNDKYETITFSRFWIDILRNETMTYEFINTNKNALEKNANISRILVVDAIKLDQYFEKGELIPEISIYIKTIKNIVRCNIKLLKKDDMFANDDSDIYRDNYNFRILFSNHHDTYEREFYNFALISTVKTGEKIIFEPGNTPSIESTKIWFCPSYTNHKDYLLKKDVLHKVAEKNEKLIKINEAWLQQKATDNIIKFINELDIEIAGNLSKRIFGPLLNKPKT